MANDEKILQLLTEMVDSLAGIKQEAVRTNERLTGVEERLTGVEERLTGVEEWQTGIEQRMAHLEQEVVKTNLMIENDISKRLNALSDGYLLTHAKQYEMERRFERQIDALEKRVEQLEIKAS